MRKIVRQNFHSGSCVDNTIFLQACHRESLASHGLRLAALTFFCYGMTVTWQRNSKTSVAVEIYYYYTGGATMNCSHGGVVSPNVKLPHYCYRCSVELGEPQN